MGKIGFVDKIKNALKYYPEEDELPIDWCPICEEKMPDNKRKTRIKHNKLKHPPDPKLKRKKLRNNLGFFAFIVFLVIGFILFGATLENQKISNAYCYYEKNKLNNYLRTEGVYPFDQQEKIDMLIEKCDLKFTLGSRTDYNPSELP